MADGGRCPSSAHPVAAADRGRPEAPDNGLRFAVAVAALGVVYGDLGTSGLYALQEAFDSRTHTLGVDQGNVLGVLSLIFWSLVIVVSVKYLMLVMRADNHGEGGILALTALVIPPGEKAKGSLRFLILLGLFGTALLYGDGMITPAMSVLSAVQGIEVAAPALDRLVVPLAIVILVGLFAVQRRGSGSLGRFFGPIMIVWFVVIAGLGAVQIVHHPVVLKAASPQYAVAFFADNGFAGFLVVGAVFLVLTGAEALYADMGHFGRRAIRTGWFALVLPSLLLNYFGQGALVLGDPSKVANPFFGLVPRWGVVPLIVLATLATIIASQALITGVFSLTTQAVQLGYLPRLRITHTSAATVGQVYVPLVNWMLMVACIALIVVFRTSQNLASAYGVAVVTTMVVTTLIFFRVSQHRLGWTRRKAVLVCGPLLMIDLGFFAANIPKIPHGGWLPLLVGTLVLILLTTWRNGREQIAAFHRAEWGRLGELRAALDAAAPSVTRVPGTAVYFTPHRGQVPGALTLNTTVNEVMHERVVLVTVSTEGVPRVEPADRAEITTEASGIVEVTLRYGFMERPDVPAALVRDAGGLDLDLDSAALHYFVDEEEVVVGQRPWWSRWRTYLFALMLRNVSNTADYFRLPSAQTTVLGSRIDL